MPLEAVIYAKIIFFTANKWDFISFSILFFFEEILRLTFPHLPLQVAGETETKGQIKLRFKTAAGKDVVCIRSFQLTQKASKMEYKAIESVLQTINPHSGEVQVLFFKEEKYHDYC